jgi:putative transposase
VEARYTYRLRVNAEQARLLQGVFDVTRFVWNQTLGRWSDLWRYEGERLSYGEASADLTDLRQTFDWLGEQPHVPQQQVIRALYKAISAFFDKKNPAGRPKFKRKGRHATAEWTKNGFKVTGTGLGLTGDRLSVATSAGRVELRVVWPRPLPSPSGMVTVYRDAVGRWWASFTVKVEAERLPASGRTTGLDLGLDVYATTEFPDADVENPRHARRAAKALARSQRNAGRKQKGSKNRAKAVRAQASLHATVANRRADFTHKAARQLARTFDRIGVEDLKVKNMSRRGKGRRKAGLNRAIADAGWRQFLSTLDWQARKAGRQVVHIDPRNTSQTCSGCGAKAKRRLGLADRIFACEACGLVLDRDRNAARNLNPGRLGCSYRVSTGDDVDKTSDPAGDLAA